MDEQEPFEVVIAVDDDEAGIHSVVGHHHVRCTFGFLVLREGLVELLL